MSNDTSMVWSIIIIKIFTCKNAWKLLFFFNELWFEKAEYECWLKKIPSNIYKVLCKPCHIALELPNTFMFIKLQNFKVC